MKARTILAAAVSLAALGCGSNAPAVNSNSTADQSASAQATSSEPARPNPDNELPFGRLDLPQPDAVVPEGKVTLSGWAVDDSAVKEVRIYVDSRFRTATTLTLARDDLKGPLPSYMHGTNVHGFVAGVELGPSPGTHTLLVQVEDDRGATRDIASMSVTVPPAQ